MNYYNEIDPWCCAALEALIEDQLIPDGKIDTRPIERVPVQDLKGFVQYHFFAGIGGWPLAFRRAGWSDHKPVWSGSCPCQPFSAAANDKKREFADARDLWPAWFQHISERCTCPLFGEQVDDNAKWIARTILQLEQAGFAVGAVDFPASAAGAPTERIRTYFVADPAQTRWEEQRRTPTVVSNKGKQQPQITTSKYNSGGAFFQDHRTTGELGRQRRVEPSIQLLAPRLRHYRHAIGAAGNAINVEAAAQFIKAYMEITS